MSGCWREQIEPARGSLGISCAQHCQDGVPDLYEHVPSDVLPAGGSDVLPADGQLKELSQKEQGKIFLLESFLIECCYTSRWRS